MDLRRWMSNHTSSALFAAEQVNYREDQIRRGDLTDHTGDLVERAVQYYARSTGTTPEEIRNAMQYLRK